MSAALALMPATCLSAPVVLARASLARDSRRRQLVAMSLVRLVALLVLGLAFMESLSLFTFVMIFMKVK